MIAKLAVGLADDALSTYAIAHRGTIVVAPAMNTSMLQHPTVQMNLATLRERGVIVLDPDSGILACGDEGSGRMPDPPVLADFVKHQFATRDLEGRAILVTAGPTREPIDPVRYISNRSSGKMGYAIAEAARRRGANVTLVSGPTAITPPAGVALTRVTTAAEMHDAVHEHVRACDVLVMCAAVSDYKPVRIATQKLEKQRGEFSLQLTATRDILASLPRDDRNYF